MGGLKCSKQRWATKAQTAQIAPPYLGGRGVGGLVEGMEEKHGMGGTGITEGGYGEATGGGIERGTGGEVQGGGTGRGSLGLHTQGGAHRGWCIHKIVHTKGGL